MSSEKNPKREKFQLLIDENQLTSEAGELLFDPSGVINRYGQLSLYFQEQSIDYDSAELEKLIELVNKSISDQVSYLAHLMFHVSHVSGDWEPLGGEQQAKTSFCRCLLQIDPEKNLASTDMSNFTILVQQNLEKMGIQSLPAETAKAKVKQHVFRVFHRDFRHNETDQLNHLLRFLGSNYALMGGTYGTEEGCIFAKGKKTRKSGFEIVEVAEEEMRTPNVIMPMVALIGDDRVIILRREAVTFIFYQKWIPMFQHDEEDKQAADPYHNISEGIKRRTLEYYEVTTERHLLEKRQTFLDDMIETTMCHELGHGVVDEIHGPVTAALSGATKQFGDNILSALEEFLADFALESNGISGPIKNMAQIARTDPQRAHRMYYMYLSDTWFFDTDNRSMYTYSDLMSLMLLKYIRSDGSVDFEQVDADIVFQPDCHTDPSMLEWLVQVVDTMTSEIENKCKSATFTVLGMPCDFTLIRSLTEQNMINSGWVMDDQSHKVQSVYWKCMLAYVNNFSETGRTIESYLKEQQQIVLKQMMVLSCGQQKSEEYQYEHRKYVVDRMTQLGIVAHKN